MLAIAIFIYNNKTINDSRYIENVRSVIISFPWERNVVEHILNYIGKILSFKLYKIYFRYH